MHILYICQFILLKSLHHIFEERKISIVQVTKTFVPQLATILHQSLMLCNVNKNPVKASFMYLFGQKLRKFFIETSYDASLIIKTKFNLRFVIAETNKRFFITLGTKRASSNSRTPKDILKDMVPILVIR